MEYSLQTLNQSSNLKTIKSSEIIDKLNLIGFEIDDSFEESFITNRFLDNLRLLIKIPPNREDLLNEKSLLTELSTIFLIELHNIWQKTRKNYSYLLKSKYNQYSDYKRVNIESDISNVLIFQIEIEPIKNFSSPLWVQNKLLNAGVPITKKIDDIILLNSLEWGQTVNTLPFKSLSAQNSDVNNLLVTQLKRKTSFLFKNATNYELSKETVVLKNKNDEIEAVLGLFTTMDDVSSRTTTKVVLQSMFYDIYENPLVLNSLENKISLRYLRKICLENFKFSFQRLLSLLEITSAAKIIPQIYSTYPNQIELKTHKILKLRKNSLLRILAIQDIDKIIFKKAGLKVICETQRDFYFSIPNYRNDLLREIDLIEEYSRFIGYKNFVPVTPQRTQKYLKSKNKNIQFIKQFFLSFGFQEVISNPLQDIRKQKDNSILLTNPLNSEFNFLRSTLLEKLVSIFENSIRLGTTSTNFFEIGRAFEKVNNNFKEVENLGLIFQLERLKKTKQPNVEWFRAKGFIENFLLHFGYKNVIFESLKSENLLFHPTKSVTLRTKNVLLGTFGEINPNLENLKALKFATYIFEVNLEYFTERRMNSTIPIYKDYSKYPAIVKDISFLINKDVNFYDLKIKIKNCSTVLRKVQFFDIYFDEKSIDSINIGVRLDFQSDSKTFTTEFIEQEMNTIKELLITEFDVEFK